MTEAERIANRYNIIRLGRSERQLSRRTWRRETAQSLRERFPNCEVNVAYNGQLITMTGSDTNVPVFEHFLQEGRPFIIDVDSDLKRGFWSPTNLGKLFGDITVTVKVIGQDDRVETTMAEYMQRLDGQAEGNWKTIGDYPESNPDLRLMVPEIVDELYSVMPFKRHLLPTGPMNMVSSTFWADAPDVGPKIFSGHGTGGAPIDPTPLHTDLGDAVNICVYGPEEEVIDDNNNEEATARTIKKKTERHPAALWHVFHRDVYDDVAG